MRFSLAIAIALLLGSYAVGVPVSSPEEGEISDHENGSNGQNGSPGQNGHTPASHHSGGTGTSSNPSLGLGLNDENRGQFGSVQLGHYASVSFSVNLTRPYTHLVITSPHVSIKTPIRTTGPSIIRRLVTAKEMVILPSHR